MHSHMHEEPLDSFEAGDHALQESHGNAAWLFSLQADDVIADHFAYASVAKAAEGHSATKKIFSNHLAFCKICLLQSTMTPSEQMTMRQWMLLRVPVEHDQQPLIATPTPLMVRCSCPMLPMSMAALVIAHWTARC